MNKVRALRKTVPGLSHALLTCDSMEEYDASSCDESHDNNMVE